MPRQAGFTLIEIVFVIGLLGGLATLAVQNLGGNNQTIKLAEAEDKVVAEIRRARARAVHQLSPTSGTNKEVAAIDDRAGPSVKVCPEEVIFQYDSPGGFRYGEGQIGSVMGVNCGDDCTDCDETAPYAINLESGEDIRTLSLNGDTGRVE